jgi:hypothetical protein
MDTLKSKLATVPSDEKTTLGRLDVEGGASTSIQGNLYYTAVGPLRHSPVRWRKKKSNPSLGFDGLYVLNRFPFRPENEDLEPVGGSLYEQVWNIPAPDLVGPDSDLPIDVLAPLTPLVRDELKKLPPDLTVWQRKIAPPYCGGLGG